MVSIRIEGEPYLYMLAKRRMVLYNLDYRRHTIVEPNEYILLDRFFNTYVVQEAQMQVFINRDFKRYNRGVNGTKPKAKKQNKDQR